MSITWMIFGLKSNHELIGNVEVDDEKLLQFLTIPQNYQFLLWTCFVGYRRREWKGGREYFW